MNKRPFTADNDRHKEEISQKVVALERIRSRMVDIALGLIGSKSRRYSGENNGMDVIGGFDCSGFVCHVLRQAIIGEDDDMVESLRRVPRHANEQFDAFGVMADYSAKSPGDLVYFARKIGGGSLYEVGHVGVVTSGLGEEIGEYVHAPGRDGSIVEAAILPRFPEELKNPSDRDIHKFKQAGIKRVTLPMGGGRWRIH